MRDLEGKVAVITGAASGIGAALAYRLAQTKMRLVLADINNERVNAVASYLDAQGVQVQSLQVDVAKAGQVDALADLAYQRFGAVHLLCNNAGVAVLGPCWEHSLGDWEWALGVNLRGVIHGIRSFVPRMLEQGGEGHIVNISDMAALLATPLSAPYVAAKQAVVGVSECLRHDLTLVDAKLGVSVVCPAFVRSEFAEPERLRPSSLPAPAVCGRLKQAADAYYRDKVAQGSEPALVAQAIVDAVRTKRFYVFPDPYAQARLRRRYEGLLAGNNPETPRLDRFGDFAGDDSSED